MAYRIEYYWGIKRNEVLIHGRARTDIENILLRNHSQRNTYCVIPVL